ncbi:hypothetical protein GCM10027592_46950 [Spirosoma flavus]
MKPYRLLLLIGLALVQSRVVRAQLVLEFAKSGRVSSTSLSAFHKPDNIAVIVNDLDERLPASKYQKLIGLRASGLLAPFSDSTQNGVNFPYKANGSKLSYIPRVLGIPAKHAITISLTRSGEAKLKITQSNIDNFILKKHFENADVRKSYVDFTPYLPTYDSLRVIYDYYAEQIEKLALQDTLSRTIPNSIQLGLTLDSITTVQSQLAGLVKKLHDANIPWINSWKWLTEGEEMLNPFFPNVGFLKSRVEQRIASQEALLLLIQNKVSSFSVSSNAYFQIKQIVSGLTTTISLLRKEKLRLDDLEQQQLKWLVASSNTVDNLNSFKLYLSEPDKPEKSEQIVWMQHKDAAQNYTSMNSDGPNTVFEEDQMMAYVHNLNPKQKVKASEKVESSTPTTTTEEALKDPFEALAKAKGSSSDILSLLAGLKSVGLSLVGNSSNSLQNKAVEVTIVGQESTLPFGEKYESDLLEVINDSSTIVAKKYEPDRHKYTFGEKKEFLISQLILLRLLKEIVLKEFTLDIQYKSVTLNSLSNAKRDTLFFEVIQNIDAQITLKSNELLYELNVEKKLISYREAKKAIQWFAIQTPPLFQELENAFANPVEEPNFRSENVLTGESRSAKGSNRISYILTEEGKSTAVAKDEYTTYKTVRFWPTLGINYVFGSRTSMVFSSTSNISDTQPDIDNFEAVAGVKIYLAKGGKNITTSAATRRKIDQIGKDNKRLGNHFNSGTFVHVGLGISHKFLRNYFFGLGHDLFPGVSVQGGAHLFFIKGYDLQNGQIKSSVDIPRFRPYVGIYLDPTLVTRLIQLF